MDKAAPAIIPALVLGLNGAIPPGERVVMATNGIGEAQLLNETAVGARGGRTPDI